MISLTSLNVFLFLFIVEAVIGFVPDTYNATEGTDLFVDLNVELISGQLGRDVLVLFNTQSGSATGLMYHVN